MKLIQISDLHFVPPGATLLGLDPRARFDAAVADINANQADAELCLITGDLADRGHPQAYAELRAVLSGLRMPYHLMIGNHDSRDTFRGAFPEVLCDDNGFVQSVVRTSAGDFLLLDTHDPGKGSGAYCTARQAWLAERLQDAGERPVYIFMHHPPFDIAIPSVDEIGLAVPEGFIRTIEAGTNLRHIFFGHVHRPMSGVWRGIPFASLRSTVHQVAFDLQKPYPVPYSFEPPGYNVILIEDDRTLVHHHDYLDDTREAADRARELYPR